MLTQAGYNSKLYTFHSERSRRALDLLKLGLSVETIKRLGRWKSNAVFRYLRYQICSIADKIKPIFDAWFIGDRFLRNINNALEDLQKQLKKDKDVPDLYMHEFYKVGIYTEIATAWLPL